MIILTGYKGFIGQNFCESLDMEDVYRVEMDGAFQFIEEYKEWDKVELIIHQGAISSTVETDINKIHKYNVEFTLKLFEKAIEYQIPVKYASSASVYGNTLTSTINPLNYYAISKVQIDYWVQQNINKFKLIQGFRYFNVYGNHECDKVKQNQSSPVSKFINNIRTQGKVQLFEGSNEMLRDFVYVGDIVDIVLNNDLKSGIYDLGTGNPVSFQYVAELLTNKLGGNIEYIPFPKHLKGKYQYYTCAKMDYIKYYDFTTVEDYVAYCIY